MTKSLAYLEMNDSSLCTVRYVFFCLQSCQLFTNMAIDSLQIDYHVLLAQNILDTCLQQMELQNELYCQLIKQTSRHPPQHKTGVQVIQSDKLYNLKRFDLLLFVRQFSKFLRVCFDHLTWMAFITAITHYTISAVFWT